MAVSRLVSGRFRYGTSAVILACAVVLVACGASPANAKGVADHLPPGAVTDCLITATCYSPHQIRTAYGIQPLLDRGIDGRGETVVLVELAARPPAPPGRTDINQDLARFDSINDLPPARIQVVNSLANSASPQVANVEEVEDTEILHAVAPAASIRVILIADAAEADPSNLIIALSAAFSLGMSQGSVVSISGSFGEHCFTAAEVSQLHTTLEAAQTRRVTVISSSGDFGAISKPCFGATGFSPVKEVGLPDADPLVLGVGGTSLTVDRTTGTYLRETAWNTSPGILQQIDHSSASGGGFSHLFARPSYQDGIAGIGPSRGVPDVAADASPFTGMALAVSDGGRRYYVTPASGTSAGAPLWAGIIALADQDADRNLGFVNPEMYEIGKSAYYDKAFHDVKVGNNTVTFPPHTITGYQATPGWDPVTGWGSPNAQVLVPLLALDSS